jgi:hypothetical protein
VIFMLRRMEEILASQTQMLIRKGKPIGNTGDEKLSQLFQRHLEQVRIWLEQQPNIDVLYVDYHEMLKDPKQGVDKISMFLGTSLDLERMAGAVDEALHRQRQ